MGDLKPSDRFVYQMRNLRPYQIWHGRHWLAANMLGHRDAERMIDADRYLAVLRRD